MGGTCEDLISNFLLARRSPDWWLGPVTGLRWLESRESGTIDIKLLSLGCGPGIDAVAVMTFLRAFAIKVLNIPSHMLKFTVTLVEQEPGWERIATGAMEAARSSLGCDIDFSFLCADAFTSDEVAEAVVSAYNTGRLVHPHKCHLHVQCRNLS